ncbi:MAG: hypothetical protein HONDAALG_00342 [Gammaproteobacteria bacterium]|nr:hypothetical protein [Gammaproteobacteria bacterium]
MKTRTGYVGYCKRRKRHFARVTTINPETGKRADITRFTKTRTEALRKKRELLNQIERDGVVSVLNERAVFDSLARKFAKGRLIPAVYIGEKKIAGRRELSAPTSWLKQLRYYFGEMKLPDITKGEIEKFRVWLSQVPARSLFEEDEESGKIILTVKTSGGQRSVESINRPVELLRTMLNYAVEEKILRADQNPFSMRSAKSLIERDAENRRERIPTFGEEMALLSVCNSERSHLRPVIIIAADSGLRENELFTLSWAKGDIDFELRQIKLRAINAKTNKPRVVQMTERVYHELLALYDQTKDSKSGLVFGGLKEVKRSFGTACRLSKIKDIHKHDWRHAFITRSILAGIPPAVVLKASGHSSEEWKRYLNVAPENLQGLFRPLPGQDAAEVRAYGLEVLEQLTVSFGYVWRDGMAVGIGSPILIEEVNDNVVGFIN